MTLGHGVAVQGGGGIGRCTRRIDKDGRDGTAVGTAAIDAQEQHHGGDRIHGVCQRQTEDNADVRSQAGNCSNHDAGEKSECDHQDALPGHGQFKA